MNGLKARSVFTAAALVAIVALTVYCMVNGLGLVDGLDFGAGAYYYADIPDFEKYVNGEHFISHFSIWVHIALFFAWGAAMFRLWLWLDKHWS